MPNTPVRYTAEIQVSNEDGTKWTAHEPAVNILDPGSADQVALNMLSHANDHSFLAGTRNGWRVCVWAGWDASKVTRPLHTLDADNWPEAALGALDEAWPRV
jgi:hypothetical protein